MKRRGKGREGIFEYIPELKVSNMAIITVKPRNESMDAIRTGAPNFFDDDTTPVPPLVAAIDADNTDDVLLLCTTILVVSDDDDAAMNGFGSSS